MSDQLEMYTRSKQISVALSQQMIPTAKLVAYLITPDGQVVADGLNFHVQPSFQHQVSFTLIILLFSGKMRCLLVALKITP